MRRSRVLKLLLPKHTNPKVVTSVGGLVLLSWIQAVHDTFGMTVCWSEHSNKITDSLWHIDRQNYFPGNDVTSDFWIISADFTTETLEHCLMSLLPSGMYGRDVCSSFHGRSTQSLRWLWVKILPQGKCSLWRYMSSNPGKYYIIWFDMKTSYAWNWKYGSKLTHNTTDVTI